MSTWNLFQEHTRSVWMGRTDTPHPGRALANIWNIWVDQWLGGVA